MPCYCDPEKVKSMGRRKCSRFGVIDEARAVRAAGGNEEIIRRHRSPRLCRRKTKQTLLHILSEISAIKARSALLTPPRKLSSYPTGVGLCFGAWGCSERRGARAKTPEARMKSHEESTFRTNSALSFPSTDVSTDVSTDISATKAPSGLPAPVESRIRAG